MTTPQTENELPEEVKEQLNGFVGACAITTGSETTKAMYVYLSELLARAEEEKAQAVKDFKRTVVKYAFDELEKDMLSGGMSERDEAILERLRYWILEKEVRNRNEGSPQPQTEREEHE